MRKNIRMTGLWAMLKLGVATAVGESRIFDVNKTSLFDLQFENNRDKQINRLSKVPEHGNILTNILMMYFGYCGLEK